MAAWVIVEDELEDNLLIIALRIVVLTEECGIGIAEITTRDATVDQRVAIEAVLVGVRVGGNAPKKMRKMLKINQKSIA